MSESTCERAADVEALVDLRLDAGARSSTLAHAEGCEACTRELAALRWLDDTMRALPSLETTRADTHRARARLTRELDGSSGEGRVGKRHAHLMFAAAMIAITVFFIERNFFRASSVPTVPTIAVVPSASTQAPRFEVANVDNATWQTIVDGNVARSSLSDGVADFHVQKLDASQRFLLALPDGELEVHGTRFVVSVRNGRTESVVVTEGVVALRLKDSPERLLHAGERWSGAAPPAPESTVPVAPREVATETVRRARAASPSPATSSAPPAAASTAPHALPAPPLVDSAADRFVTAAAAFQSGSYARADVLLAAFVHDFPSDPRCEDATFLRAMARARLGDREGAATIAAGYLRSFPNGLRRPEAEQLVRER